MKLIRTFAVLFAVLTISNLIKPLEAEGQGFVLMGRRLSGTPNIIAAWSFAAFLGTYAYSLWNKHARALPMGIAYACYVIANTAFFQVNMAATDNNPLFGVTYVAIALSVSWGAVAVMIREGFADAYDEKAMIALKCFGFLFALLALSNLLKSFGYHEGTGLVLFGQRLQGTPNTIGSLIFSGFLAVYAATILAERKPAVALGTVYALYVVANLVLWNFRKPDGAERPVLFAIGYLVSALGVSGGAAYLLRRHADRFV